MKKIISYFIAIMMVFTMIPYTAFAESEQPAADTNVAEQTALESINLYVQQPNPLYSDDERIVEVIDGDIAMFSESADAHSDSEQATTIEEAAAILRAGMVERQNEVVVKLKISANDLTQEAMDAKISAIFEEVMVHTGKVNEGDSLKWVYERIDAGISAGFDGSSYYAEFTFMPAYYTTAEQEAALTAAVEKLKADLALDGKSDYEKVKAIYDYMTANITYDYDHYGNDAYKLQFTSYAALVNKTSVCQGYATLFYRMACEYGIDARVIAGTSLNNRGQVEGHSWNIVKLGSKYYNLDATWDSTWDADKKTHDFFLQGVSSFDNHTRDAEYATAGFNAAYPMSETDYVPGTDEDQNGSEGEEPEQPVEPDKPVKPEEPDTPDIPAPGHTYGEWVSDANNHWKECACGDIAEKAAHEYEWIIDTPATEDAEGSKHQECTVCRAKGETESIGKLEHVHAMVKKEAVAADCETEGNIEYYVCSKCDKLYADAEGKNEITKSDTVIGAVAHIFTEVITEPTCTEAGKAELVCIDCGKTILKNTVPAKGHTPDGNPIIEPTCEKDGLILTVKCSVCGEIIKEQEYIPALGHVAKVKIVKSTSKKSGSIVKTCKTCGKQLSKKTVYRISAMTLSKTKYIYDGKIKKPTVTVKDTKKKKLVKGTDYTIKFKNQQGKVVSSPKTVGKYTVIVTFKGNYSGTISKTFTISPKATAISKLTRPGKKQIKVTWKKQTAQTTGYQIQYSTSKNFTKKTTKTVKVKGYKTSAKTIKQLKSKKKYWVKIRTYKTVGKTTFYSAWSKAKTVTTK